MKYLILVATLLSSSSLATANPPTKEQLYLQALQHHQAKEYDKAAAVFRETLGLFVKAQAALTKNSRAWHQYTLGQSDIISRLADIAWAKQHKRRSCRLRQELESLRKTLPRQWKTWVAHSPLPRRLDESRRLFLLICPKVPSRILLKVTPQRARLSYKTSSGQWAAMQPIPFPTVQTTLTIKADAPGYQTKQVQMTVKRWQTQTLSLPLLLAPKPPTASRPTTRPIARVREPTTRIARVPPHPRIKPKLPPPFALHKQWWFWTITGVLVAGGATAAIVAATIPGQIVIQGKEKGTPYKIWN